MAWGVRRSAAHSCDARYFVLLSRGIFYPVPRARDKGQNRVQKISPQCMKAFFITVLLFLLSFLGWHWPYFNAVFAGIITLGVVFIYFKYPETALGLVIAELAMGGKGWWLSIQFGDTVLPIRILIFTAIFLAWLGSVLMQLRNGSPKFSTLKNIPAGIRCALIILGLSIVWGAGWGLVRGNGFGAVFFDANAWIYFLLFLPLFPLVGEGKGELLLKRILAFVLGAGLANALLSLVLFHVFAHQYEFTPTLYQWIRDAQLGEITFIRPGAWRIFMQSQVWLLFVAAWYLIAGSVQSEQKQKVNLLLLAVVLAALFVSFSRSYWVGLAAVSLSGIVLLLRNHAASWKRIAIVIIGGAMGAIVLTVAFQRLPPIPAGIPLRERLTIEAAGSSRMNQLIPLMKAIAKHPIIGSGFGTAVTYVSADPRIIARSPGGGGEYTTSAFEWGYLDIWLKIGLVGLIAYIWLLIYILREMYRKSISIPISNDRGILVRVCFTMVLFCALVAFMSVHITSPYLNHPLGIGMVVLCLITAVANTSQNFNN